MPRVEVSSKVRFFSNIAIASTSSAYAASRVIGGLITVSGALRSVNRTGLVSSVFLADSNNGTAPITLLFFDSDPGATLIDNTALSVSAANMVSKCVGYVNINKSDYVQFGATSGSLACLNNVGLNLESSDPINQSIYIIAVTNGAVTLAASSLKLTLSIIQD